jgi:hypothetical protein
MADQNSFSLEEACKQMDMDRFCKGHSSEGHDEIRDHKGPLV